MTLKEIGRIDHIGSWAADFAAPSGLISTKEQYDYFTSYPVFFNWHDPKKMSGMERPSFEECLGKYLCVEECFGNFYFCLRNSGEPWSWGDYGRVDFTCRKCKYEKKYWNNEPCINCCGCDKFEERIK